MTDLADEHMIKRYCTSVIELQKFVTWFNMKLISIETAVTNAELFAGEQQ